jgi:hypothetical protein
MDRKRIYKNCPSPATGSPGTDVCADENIVTLLRLPLAPPNSGGEEVTPEADAFYGSCRCLARVVEGISI